MANSGSIPSRIVFASLAPNDPFIIPSRHSKIDVIWRKDEAVVAAVVSSSSESESLATKALLPSQVVQLCMEKISSSATFEPWLLAPSIRQHVSAAPSTSFSSLSIFFVNVSTIGPTKVDNDFTLAASEAERDAMSPSISGHAILKSTCNASSERTLL